jgi:alginate O-acetyltransferase complex protein AlgI
VVFSSVPFLFYFLPVFLVSYFALGRKNITILLFSLVFYAWGEPRFLPVLIAYIVVNYAIGRLIGRDEAARRAWMVAGVACNLGLLAYFKYLDFLSAQMSAIYAWAGLGRLPVAHVPLPLGISFIAFQGVSYVVDVYRRVVAPQRSLLDFAMYKAMFPQLIAGPIVRYSDIAAGISRRPVLASDLMAGTRQFILGLGQKVLIANVLAAPADQIFALPIADLGSTTAWLGVLCYTLQIFFDFAGYSNMAIGLGRIMGFRYPQNFDRPYASQSITEFWRRWHMTLSRWFRDYLYVPLGGNRVSALRTYANLLTVFLLCGLWHGANWTFLAWGAFHGAFLVIERLGFNKVLDRTWRPLRHLYLMLVVMVGWVLFRSATITAAIGYLGVLAGGIQAPALQPPDRYLGGETLGALCAGTLLATLPAAQALNLFPLRVHNRVLRGAASGFAHAVLLAMLMVCLLDVASGAYNPFIYYRF